jgi:hypothetical protein
MYPGLWAVGTLHSTATLSIQRVITICMGSGSCTVSIFSSPAMATLAKQAIIFFSTFIGPNPNLIYITYIVINILCHHQLKFLTATSKMTSYNPESQTLSSHAPDSPRSSQSPPPSGVQGDLELELLGLANALYNLGTTVINDSTKDRDRPGGAKLVGLGACVLFTAPVIYDPKDSNA